MDDQSSKYPQYIGSTDKINEEIKEAVKELDLKAYEDIIEQEMNSRKLNPMMFGLSIGGVIFGSGILLNTALKRRVLNRSIRLRQYVFGFGLIAFNMAHIANNQILQKPKTIQHKQPKVKKRELIEEAKE